MSVDFSATIENFLSTDGANARFTQDTPVYPEVWRAYAGVAMSREDSRGERVDLLLTPHLESSAMDLLCAIAVRLQDYVGGTSADRVSIASAGESARGEGAGDGDDDWLKPFGLSATETNVAVSLSFQELVCMVLPLTHWWQRVAVSQDSKKGEHFESLGSYIRGLAGENARPHRVAKALTDIKASRLTPSGAWFYDLVGLLWWRMGIKNYRPVSAELMRRKAAELLLTAQEASETPKLWGIFRNRRLEPSIHRSVPAIKGDAASLLFKPDTSTIAWAVVDSGIDATHPAFRKRIADSSVEKPYEVPFVREGDRVLNRTRVVETYDFTRMRTTLALRASDISKNISEMSGAFDQRARELRRSLSSGRFFDWEEILEEIRVRYDQEDPLQGVPEQAHGTHVAGILAADWEDSSVILRGVCPALRLYDLRVVDRDGAGDEYSVLAALHFVRYRNATSELPVIHGVNISMSIDHDVRNYACGQTPVCEECDRLVASGTVVVAAAGNRGYALFQGNMGQESSGYRASGITDPGNSERVITVGATHRYQPHKYGVSFFSSRGPTGDGRMKPDLVAPGEKIRAPVPGGDTSSLDGTSMAAPHVSGAAALLMARYSELIGKPERIKQILCDTATDLGRERNFQGAGMLDVLRALQSI